MHGNDGMPHIHLLTGASGVALPPLARASTKRARQEKLRENCIVEVGERDGDLGQDGGVRERVVLGRGQSRYKSFIPLRRGIRLNTHVFMVVPPP